MIDFLQPVFTTEALTHRTFTTMSLSLNWNQLKAKLGEKKTSQQPNKVQKKSKNVLRPKIVKKAVSVRNETPNVNEKTISSPKNQEASVLEYALWKTDSAQKLDLSIGKGTRRVIVPDHRKLSIGKFIAMDCEFVGVGEKDRSALARVSIVNMYGVVILDEYVRPKERVTDWRTWVSGVSPHHMKSAITFEEAQERVEKLMKDRTLVGHSLKNDMKALQLGLKGVQVEDTSMITEFRELAKGKAPSLRRLCQTLLQLEIQTGQHSSVEDAQATMALYRLYRWHKQNKKSMVSLPAVPQKNT